MPMLIETNNGLAEIQIEGELTIFCASEMQEKLSEPVATAREIEIDLSRVSDIDAAGLQLLLMAKLVCNQRGCLLRLVKHSDTVQELLELSNTISFFGDPVVMQAQIH